jgi:release factor glutamine methyltransferase
LSVTEALRLGADLLHGSPTASLDTQLLLAHSLGTSRSSVIASGDRSIADEQAAVFRQLLARRSDGVPVAYLRGFVEWWDLRLRVTPEVMVPRPESEILVEVAIAAARQIGARRIVDVGTGSGALAIALARALPTATLVAIDLSSSALDVARDNFSDYGLKHRIALIQGDLVAPLADPSDMVVANLPYLSDEMMGRLGPDVRHEPACALRGGGDGLDLYRRMVDQISARDWSPCMVIEIDPGQTRAVLAYLMGAGHGPSVDVVRDYSGRDRVVVVRP